MTILIIAEKPNQARKYLEALGKGTKYNGYYEIEKSLLNDKTIVTWCVGHLVRLANMEEYNSDYKNWNKEQLPFIPEKFKFKISDSVKKQFIVIKKLCMDLDEKSKIIIATDPDREGEAIARYVLNQIPTTENLSIKRLWANTLEKNGLQEAFRNLKNADDTYKYYLEAEARAIADWIVGINFTRFITLQMNEIGIKRGVFSVGRVQTPTLYMVYQRNKEIENFKSKKYYKMQGVDKDSIPNCIFKSNQKFRDKIHYQEFLNSQDISEIDDFEITSIEAKEIKKSPPNLYKLGGIQKVANQKWKYSLDKTLSIIQSLYDKGILSYPRTDCNLITKNEFNYLKQSFHEYQSLLGKDIKLIKEKPQSKYVNDEKVLEHYAIIPTKKIPTQSEIDNLSEAEKNIYLEIVENTLLMFEEDYTFYETIVKVTKNDIEFIARGKIDKQLGWKKFVSNNESKNDKVITELPKYKKGQMIKLHIKVEEQATKPPKYLTEATLGGEGGLMETCAKQIVDENKKIQLNKMHGIGTPATRSNIIKGLIDKEYMYIQENHLFISEKGKLLCEALKETKLISVELTAQWELQLKTIEERGTREAQNQFIQSIKRFTEELFINPKTIIKNSISEKFSRQFNETISIGSCPKCQSSVREIKSKKGQLLFACINKDCDFFIWNEIAGKKITINIVKELLDKGQTNVIKGFKNSKGKTFKAKLKLTKEGVKFESSNKK